MEDNSEKTLKRQKRLKSIFNKALLNYHSYDFSFDNKMVSAYGGSKRDRWPYYGLTFEDMPVLFECVRAMPEKKIGRQSLLHHLYQILKEVERPLPFAKVEELFEDIRQGKTLIPAEVYKGYEDTKSAVCYDKEIIIKDVADLSKFKDVKRLLTDMVEDIDDYVKCWQLHTIYIGLQTAGKPHAAPLNEDDVFRAAFDYPELHPMLETILRKVMDANKIYPLFKEYGSTDQMWRYYTAYSIMGYFTALDPKKYDKVLLEYIQDIEAELGNRPGLSKMPYYLGYNHLTDHIQRISRFLANIQVSDLPLTVSQYPYLAECIKTQKAKK